MVDILMDQSSPVKFCTFSCFMDCMIGLPLRNLLDYHGHIVEILLGQYCPVKFCLFPHGWHESSRIEKSGGLPWPDRYTWFGYIQTDSALLGLGY
jgi:hypothetical protein